MMDGRKRLWVVCRLGWMIVLVRSSLIFHTTSFGGAPRLRRSFPIGWGWPSAVPVIQTCSILVTCRLFLRTVIIVPFPKPLGSNWRSVVSIPGSRFGSRERRSWGRRTACNSTRTRKVWVMVMRLVWILRAWRWWSSLYDRSHFRRWCVHPAIRWHWSLTWRYLRWRCVDARCCYLRNTT